jgi:dTDP-4-dehydrorhamnose reductase
MRVVILGANGQLGSDLLRGWQSRTAKSELVPLYRKDLDVSDLESIPKALANLQFDVLINCTGYHKTDEVEKHATEAVQINGHAVRILAQTCRSLRARYIHISTDYIFGGDSTRPYVEGDSPRPLNVYGASKLLGENLALREYGDATLILRVASLFGVAGASGKGGNFVETILRVAKEKGHLRVVHDITMSPTGTAEAARIISSLVENAAPPGVYHVVNSGQATWFEFASEILRQAGVHVPVTPVTGEESPAVAARPLYSVLENRKASSIVGTISSWEQALTHYLKAKGHIR